MKQRPTEPTQEWCGSPGKIAVMATRAAYGLPLFVVGDCPRKVEIDSHHHTGRGSNREKLADLLVAMTRPRHRPQVRLHIP
jgi:hypothetical protein